jgi:hypothetical protein
VEQSAWSEVAAAVSTAPYPLVVLPVDAERAAAELRTLEITTRSWLGAVVANTGGLTVDHGWLRVLGGGHAGLPGVAEQFAAGRGLIIAHDVLGGQFGWWRGAQGGSPTVHYFGPDTLQWLDLEVGYGDWLHGMLAGALTQFCDGLRWPGWETEVAALDLDHGISAFPPPWTAEGKDLSVVSRRPVPLAEIVAVNEDVVRQIFPGSSPRR